MKLIIVGIIFIISVSVAAGDSYIDYENKVYSVKYTVKKGDTLSEILDSHGYKGIFRNLKKQKHLNPIHLVLWKNGMRWKDLQQLEPGQIIYLPIKPGQQVERKIASESDVVIEDMSYQEVQQKVEEYRQEKAGNSWF